MTPTEEAWKRVVLSSVTSATVEARLARQGALIELRQFQGMSAQEIDCLLYREVHDL